MSDHDAVRLRRAWLVFTEHVIRDMRLRQIVGWLAEQRWVIWFEEHTRWMPSPRQLEPVLWLLLIAWGAFLTVMALTR